MKKHVNLKNITFLILAVLVFIQFFQPERNSVTYPKENEIFAVLEADQQVVALITSACYDCHSFQTNYPWYSYVAPVSWWIMDHIEHGRSELNFSKWREYDNKKAAMKLKACFEEVAKGKMPLESYQWGHSEARLTEAQRVRLVSWFKRSKNIIENKQAKKQ